MKKDRWILAGIVSAVIGGTGIYMACSTPSQTHRPDPAPPRSAPPPAPAPGSVGRVDAGGLEKMATPLPPNESAERGLAWLVAAQNADGGWGEDKQTDPDVATTAACTLALIRAGHTPTAGKWSEAVRKGIEYVRAHVAASPAEGVEVNTRKVTQPQRKLGPYIDTTLAALLLGKAVELMPDPELTKGVSAALAKAVKKVEAGQLPNGSWNAGGWAPVLNSSFAFMSLEHAKSIEGKTGVKVDDAKLALATKYNETLVATATSPAATFETGTPVAGGAAGGSVSGRFSGFDRGDAGVELYTAASAARSQAADAKKAEDESLAKSEADASAREAAGDRVAAQQIRAEAPKAAMEARPAAFKAAIARLGDDRVLLGLGTMGGEEFVSYMMTSDSLAKLKGEEFTKWNSQIKDRLVKLQNADGTWCGHHCITSKTFCTAAAVLTIYAEREIAQ